MNHSANISNDLNNLYCKFSFKNRVKRLMLVLDLKTLLNLSLRHEQFCKPTIYVLHYDFIIRTRKNQKA